ncbi:hypothetical protein [Chitinophaga sp. 212800010-3]|uniref:hypothetical protein n=1 Tax=unclassified Chitinophaga TaxID=2619133 RepID=UPI002DF38F69|nr:hypothetical protein [Chitinophaga sp. 212800010-3]
MYVKSILTMMSIPTPPLNEEVTAGGYFNEGDGGGGTFIWVPVTTLPVLDQGIHIKHNTRTDGYFLRLYSGSISARWFGASEAQVDNTTALQAAIDYCVSNDLNLQLNGDFKIASSLFIDRQVDSQIFADYFVISDGAISTENNIAVFSTRLPANDKNTPLTQLVRFREIVFKGNSANAGVYVLDSNKYLRTSFEGCSFTGIKFLTSNYYVQSIYMTNCQARYWNGIFFNTTAGSYDIRIATSIFESGESFANFSATTATSDRVSNVCIINNLIENMRGYGIQYNLTSSLVISFNYFEENALGDILCADTVGIAQENRGVAVIGNFHHRKQTDENFYPVIWGATKGGVSLSNTSSQNLDQFNTSVSEVFAGNAAAWNNANTPDHFSTTKIYFGTSPAVNGGVVYYSSAVSRGTIVFNTSITSQTPNIGWICIQEGTYLTAKWAAFGTTNALVENKSIVLTGSENLNTMTASGYFFPVTVANWVNTGVNYPVNQRGVLKVLYSENPSTAEVIQEYTTISMGVTDKVKIYYRTYYGYGGYWSPWVQVQTV